MQKISMSKFKTYFLSIFFIFSLQTSVVSQNIPGSFADLAEKLMPSVVNISTTTVITTQSNPFPFQFPPGSPFEDMDAVLILNITIKTKLNFKIFFIILTFKTPDYEKSN